jgi:hypothetical protein
LNQTIFPDLRIEVEGGGSLVSILRFMHKHQGYCLLTLVFLEVQMLVCLLAGALFLKGGLW